MGDKQDSWLSGVGVDVGNFFDSVVKTVENKASAAVQEVKNVVQKMENAASSAVKTVTGAPVSRAPASPTGAPKPKPSTGSGGGLSLGGSVGRGGKNNPDDVKAVQRALRISDDGKCGHATIKAIENFQRTLGQAKPDGRIDPGGPTSRALAGGGKAAPTAAPPPSVPPAPKDEDSGSLFDEFVQGGKAMGDRARQRFADLRSEIKPPEQKPPESGDNKPLAGIDGPSRPDQDKKALDSLSTEQKTPEDRGKEDKEAAGRTLPGCVPST